MAPGWFARWVEHEQRQFFLLLPLSMGAGILVYFNLPSEPPLWLVAAPLAAGLLLAAWWKHPYARFAALLLLAAALGFARAEWRTAALPPMPILPIGIVKLSGVVAQIEPVPGGTRVRLRAPQLDQGPVQARDVRVRLRAGDPPPVPGSRVQTYAMLFSPERPAYPGGWDQGRDAFFANRAGSGFALTPLIILRAAPVGLTAAWLQEGRAAIAAAALAALPMPRAAIAVTLLTGDEQIIPADIRQDFITAGLAHILAVAGLHVGIVMGLVFYATRFLLSRFAWTALHWPGKPIAAVASLAGGVGYALLTGAHLPILRSLAMASLVTLGILLGRRAISLRGLALAAMVLLLLMPEVILSASFQMSFSAVAALIAGYGWVHPLWRRLHASRGPERMVLLRVAELVLTSLLAGGASMPFSAYQFQQIQPYWIPANLIAVPLTALWIMPWGMLALALAPLHLAALAFVPMGWGIALIIAITAHIATWPDALLAVPPEPGRAALCFALGVAFLCIWRGRLRLAGPGFLAAGLVLALLARPPDVLVSPEASLIAIRQGARVLLVQQPRASAFTLAQWRSVWGGQALTPAQCTASTCRLGRILFASVAVTDCGGASILVSPVEQPGCPGALVLDRMQAYRQGALAGWLTAGGAVWRSDRLVQGARPWVPVWPQP